MRFLLIVMLFVILSKGELRALQQIGITNHPDSVIVFSSDTLSFLNLTSAEKSVTTLSHKIDSLQSLNLPTQKYRKQLDSISNALQSKVMFNPTNKIDSLKTSISRKFHKRRRTAKTDSVQYELEHRMNKITNVQDSLAVELEKRRVALRNKIKLKTHFLDSIAAETGMPNLDPKLPAHLKLPGINGLPQTDIPNLDINTQIPVDTGFELPNKDLSLPNNQLPDIKENIANNPLGEPANNIKEAHGDIASKVKDNDVVSKVTDVKEKVGAVEETIQKVDIYSKEIKEIKENGIAEADELKSEAEKRVQEQIMKQDAMKDLATVNRDLAESRNILEQYHDMLASLKDKDKAIEVAKETIQDQNFADPFIQKEQNLKAGIEQLDKLKKKYGTIADSRYLPKRAPNQMKGKPFRERIVPGLSFQVFTGNQTAIDIQPYVAYKLTGRFRPGIGASYRANFQFKKPFARYDEVYGYRIFNDFRAYGTFFLHTEGEWLHFSSSAKLRYQFPADKDFGDWQFRFNAGLFRTYTINKRLTGQFLVLYNVADLTRFPQNRNTSMRFGFEYKFKPTKKE